MNHNILASSIKNNDINTYLQLRFPDDTEGYPDGTELIFDRIDFSGISFNNFQTDMWTFQSCILDGCRGFNGVPQTFIACSAKNMDISDSWLVFTANRTNFTGCIFDKKTKLGDYDVNIPSQFTNCTVDKAFYAHFSKQGVTFTDCVIV